MDYDIHRNRYHYRNSDDETMKQKRTMPKKDAIALMLSFYITAFAFYLASRNGVRTKKDFIIFLIVFVILLILPLFIPAIVKIEKKESKL